MKVIAEAINGVVVGDGNLHAVRLLADGDNSHQIYLTYALVTLGPEEHVFPCSVLDDWGTQIRGLPAYGWMRDNGNHFPRAEIFAIGIDGEERQHFLREFELYARYPVYALASRESPITDAVPIRAMLIVADDVAEPVRTKRPAGVSGPLARARVSWWLVPRNQQELSFLETETVS